MTWVLAVVPFSLLILGVPIYLIFLATTVLVLAVFMNLPATMIPQNIFGSLDSFTLLAVPFFIFAGELMGRGGIATRLVQWFMAMFGGVRGSLALVTVASCELFGTMSGSSPATVAAIGRLMYPALRDHGYGEKFSLGLVTSTGAIATVIPPSILMILYGASAEQSVAKLFLGGFFPGLLIGALIAGYIFWYASRTGLPVTGRFTWPAFRGASLNAVWALGVPFVILGGIYSGIFTPTEAAGIAGVYGILVGAFVYRDIGWRGIWEIAMNSGLVTAQIMIIVAASGVFSWVLTISGVPQFLADTIEALHAPQWGVLLAINILLLIVGCLVDPTSATLVLTPLLLPLVKAVGVDPVHFGIILTVNLSIGMFTPPFGLNIFMAQSLFNAPTTKAEGKGIKGISMIVYGPASFVSRTPIRIPDDMKGKKFRILATPIETAMMAALGATGVPMPLGEVLPALQQGAMDGVESGLTVFTTFKYYDVAKFHTNTNHYFITSIGTISKKWFDTLSPDIQRAVVEEGRAVHAELLDWTKNFYQTAVNVWKEKTKDGWLELTAEQRAAFRKQLEGVDARVAQEVPALREWLDFLRAKARALR